MHNMLRAQNPFQLTEPPAWWLRELALFDNRLVVFPSQRQATFILARRAFKSKGEVPHDAKGLTQNPDTLIMATNRLVRVCEILPGVIWDMRIFKTLAAHDIQRLGGPKAVADRLDARDNTTRANIQQDQNDEIAARARDGYKVYKYKIGERISLTPSSRHGRGDLKVTPVSVHVPEPTAPSAPLIPLA